MVGLLIGIAFCTYVIISYGMLPFFLIAVILSLVYANCLKSFYEQNGYFLERLLLEQFFLGVFMSGIIMTVGAFSFNSAGKSGARFLSLLAAAAALIVQYIYRTRHAGEWDKKTKDQCEKLAAAAEKYSHYAYIVSFFCETEENSSAPYIRADIYMVEDEGVPKKETVCSGNNIDLERFWSYAQEHYPGQVSGSKRYISITFQENANK